MIQRGIPLKFERGTCPGMDENNHPDGYYIRVGKGLPPFAFEQDCDIYEANKYRIQVVEQMTNVGVTVPAIEIIGDGNGLTGGAYIMRPLDNPTTWESGLGLRQTVVFSPQSLTNRYINFEWRGRIPVELHNEGSAVLNVTITDDLFKVMYYRDASAGEGGGARRVIEFPFAFEPFGWYKLIKRMVPDPTAENTWFTRVRMVDLSGCVAPVKWDAPLEDRPNQVESITFKCGGDEQQGNTEAGLRGGTWRITVFEDERIEQ